MNWKTDNSWLPGVLRLRGGELERVRFPVNARANRLPSSGASFEVPESLCQLKGLNDDALLLFIVAQLSVAGQREILAERVSIETVVRHNTTQIRVAAEEDTKQVVDLTLVPQSSFVQTRHTGHGAGLVRIGLNTDTGVIADAQQVVDDLEALVTSGEINRGNIGDLGEFGCRVVFQEAHDRDDAGGRNVDRELVLPHRELLNVFGQAGHDILAVLVQALGLVLVLVGGVDDRRAKSSLGGTVRLAHILRLRNFGGELHGRREGTACLGRPHGRCQRAASAQSHQGASRGHDGRTMADPEKEIEALEGRFKQPETSTGSWLARTSRLPGTRQSRAG